MNGTHGRYNKPNCWGGQLLAIQYSGYWTGVAGPLEGSRIDIRATLNFNWGRGWKLQDYFK
jgi:hypothetical protein